MAELSMVDGWVRFHVSSTVSWAVPGKSDHVLCWS